jgi:hypothetical protein
MSLIRTNIVNLLRRKFQLAALLFISTVFALPTFSATEQEERWFEIEVILFSQLGDKTQLKESFPNQEQQASVLPNYRKVRDLLTPYIYPDITTLKLQLPQCDDILTQNSSLSLVSNPQTLYPLKSLVQIKQTYFDEKVDDTTTSRTVSQPIDIEINTIIEYDLIPSITKQQTTLLSPTELAHSSLSFDHSNQATNMLLCHLPTIFDDKFSINFKGTVDGNEYINSEDSYLISKDSLQLTDIVISLKRSQNFKPLLHLGWREAPQDLNKATAHRLFSGDNLAFEYQKEQFTYQVKKTSTQESIDQITAQENNDSSHVNLKAKIETEQILQESINRILSNINDVTAADEQKLLAQINSKDLAIDLNIADSVKQPSPPIKPSQPWTLDGLFRVHLNHYLYITADFNLLSLTAEQQKMTVHKFNTTKSIRFNQNRRVISGEIHYFDHPYIGMIVQIRKHERAKPEVNGESLDNGNELEMVTTPK